MTSNTCKGAIQYTRMPKMKTHKGAIKRVYQTGSKTDPKLMRRKRVIGAKGKATQSAKHKTRRPVEVAQSDRKVFKRLIPGV